VKFAFFSDLHLDTVFTWAAPEQASQRRQGLRNTLKRIVEMVRQEHVDVLLCGGDLFDHDYITPDTSRFIQSCFEELNPIPIYISPGNKDCYNRYSTYQRMKFTSNVHIFTQNTLEPMTIAEGLTIWGAGHQTSTKQDGFLDNFKVNRGGTHLALFHGSEQGQMSIQDKGKSFCAPFREEQVHQAGIHHAFVGHFHIPKDADWYTYAGNPEPLNFNESIFSEDASRPMGEIDGNSNKPTQINDTQTVRGVVIAELTDTKQLQRWRIPVSPVKVYDIMIDITGCTTKNEAGTRVIEALRNLTGIVRVILYGVVPPTIEFNPRTDLENLSLGITSNVEAYIVQVGNLKIGYDIALISTEPTVRGEFVRDVTAKSGISESEKHRIISTALRALENRIDLEVY
jgi:hypothetical protein